MEKQITKLIPAFILEKFTRKIYEGELVAAVLYLDIAGFTSITEKLMRDGMEGAERTSEILNEVFTPCIREVYIRNGFIPHFMGDGFLAIFPAQEIEIALSSAQKIADIFNKKKGDFEVSVSYKIAISYGDVRWKIQKNRFKNTYFFYGPAIDVVNELEKQCEPGKILCSELTDKIVKKPNGHSGLQIAQRNTHKEQEKTQIKKKKLTVFVGDKLIHNSPENEFRNVIPCFISIQKGKESDNIINQIISTSNSCGGYYKDAIIEKGEIRALVYFGSPYAVEKPFNRALDFSLSLIEEFGTKVKIGLTSGIMFSGFIGSGYRKEFLVIGERVNLASRLCAVSKWGKILTDDVVYKNAQAVFAFRSPEEYKLKGYQQKIIAYRVLTRKTTRAKQDLLIGREEELRELAKEIKKLAADRNARILHVVGEAGIGKSYLVDTVHQDLGKRSPENYLWITLTCNELISSAYSPFVNFFREYFQISNEFSLDKNRNIFNQKLSHLIEKSKDREASEQLHRTRSCIAALLGLQWEDSLYQELEAKGRQENTILSIISFIRALVSIKPLIVEIEDIHWIDSYSAHLFTQLFGELKKKPLLVITTSRFLEERSYFNFDQENIKETIIQLPALEKGLVKPLVESRLGERISDELLELIWEKSIGNPFYVEQISEYLSETNQLVNQNNTLYPADRFKHKEEKIPETIQAVIIARIDQLTSGLKELVKTASVLGREFATEVLSAMLKNKKIDELLDDGEKKDIWNSLNELIYIFKHALIRDSVYQMQLKKQLKRLHRIAAESIESVYANNLEQHFEDLAYHYENAKIVGKACEYLEKAGLYAQKNYYNEKAIELFEYYLSLSKNDDGHSPKWNFVKNQLGLVYQHIGKLQKAIEIFTEVIDTASEDSEEVGFALNYLGWIRYLQHDYQDALKWFERAIITFKKINHHQGLAITYGHFAVIYLNSKKFELAEEFFNKKLDLCNKYTLKNEKITAFVNMGVLYRYMGQPEKSLTYLFKVLEESSKVKNIKFKMAAYVNIGDNYHVLGDFKKAFMYYKKDLKLCQKTGDARQLSIIYEKLAKLYTHRKNYKKGYDFASLKLQHDLKFNYKFGQQRAFQQLGIISYIRRDYNDALSYYKKELKLKSKQDKIYPLAYTYFNIGLVYEKMKKYQKALEYYDKAHHSLTQPYEKIRTTFIYEKALVYRKMRRYKNAREWFLKLKTLAEKFSQTRYIIFASAELINLDFNKAETNETRRELLTEMEKLFDIAETEEEKKTITRGVKSFLRRVERHEARE